MTKIAVLFKSYWDIYQIFCDHHVMISDGIYLEEISVKFMNNESKHKVYQSSSSFIIFQWY